MDHYDENKDYSVYILECADGTYYTGITNNIKRRLTFHNRGQASRYTRARLPVKLCYLEKGWSKPEALRREIEIKRLSREQKKQLITLGKSVDQRD